MSKAAPPHGVGVILIDRILVASNEGNRDTGGGGTETRRHMIAQLLTNAVQTPRRRRLDDRNRTHRLADRTDPLEPGVARKVVSAGESHWRWRREAGAHLHECAGSNACREL